MLRSALFGSLFDSVLVSFALKGASIVPTSINEVGMKLIVTFLWL